MQESCQALAREARSVAWGLQMQDACREAYSDSGTFYVPRGIRNEPRGEVYPWIKYTSTQLIRNYSAIQAQNAGKRGSGARN